MGLGSQIKAGAAYVEISTRNSKLVKGLKGAAKELKTFGTAVGATGLKVLGVGTAMITPFLGAAKVFADTGSELVDMSQRTGMSVESISELGYAAEQSGADLATLETAAKKMQKKIVEAAGGSKEATQGLADLGLSVEQLAGMSPDQQLTAIGDAINNIQDPALRTAAAMDIFGKSGTQLLPMFANGAKGVEELRQQARDLGLTMDTETAQGAEAFGDQLDTVWKQAKKIAVEIGGALLPDLKEFGATASSIATKTIAWIKENRELVALVFRIALGVAAAGAALVVLGGIFMAASMAISTVVAIAGAFGTAISAAGSVVAFLISPLGILIALVVGLGGYFLYTSGAIGTASESIMGTLSSLLSTAQSTFGGIMDAVRAGDLGLAAAIGWAGLKVVWNQGVAWVMDKWDGLRSFVLDGWSRLNEGIASLVIDFWAGLQSAFVSGRSSVVGIVIGMAKLVVSALGTLPQSVLDFLGINVNSMKSTLTAMASGNTAGAAKEQAAIEKDRKGAQGTLGDMTNQEISRRDAARQKRADGRQAAVDAAQQELDDLRAQAAEAATAAAAASTSTTAHTDDLPDADELMHQAQKKIDVSGTFNAAVAGSMGATSAQDRTAAATEETARNTKAMRSSQQPSFS